jgi:hypothetical protein
MAATKMKPHKRQPSAFDNAAVLELISCAAEDEANRIVDMAQAERWEEAATHARDLVQVLEALAAHAERGKGRR